MDTTDVESGMSRVKKGMSGMEAQVNSSRGSMEGLASIAKKVSTSLIAIGVGGVSAFTALATKSPAVAGSLAKMSIEMREMSFTAGSLLKPAFESIANDLLPSINSAIDRNKETISDFVTIVEGAVTVVTKLLDLVEPFAPKPTAGEEEAFGSFADTAAWGRGMFEQIKENPIQTLLGGPAQLHLGSLLLTLISDSIDAMSNKEVSMGTESTTVRSV